jgi:hypothetical protein
MDIQAVKGDSEYYDLRAIRSNQPIDLNGDNVKIWFTAKRVKSDSDDDALIQLNNVDHPAQIVFVNKEQGLFYVGLYPADTVDIQEEYLVYDIQVREQAANRITTIASGNLKLTRDITRIT